MDSVSVGERGEGEEEGGGWGEGAERESEWVGEMKKRREGVRKRCMTTYPASVDPRTCARTCGAEQEGHLW